MPTIRRGPLNLITDVEGIEVGNAEDERAWTGTTVILPDGPATAAVDVRGGAPGTRETDALDPSRLVEGVHALVLSGGSAFGLDAASAVASWLASRGIGFAVGGARVPIVPAAILFDLLNGGDKNWGETAPYRELGYRAAATAGRHFALGTAGAGFGANAGRLKGGLGSVSTVTDDGLQIGALVAVNAMGSVVMPGQDCLWAWPFEQEGELGGQPLPRGPVGSELDGDMGLPGSETNDGNVPTNTTIGVVATNACISKSEALRIAIMAQDGYARAIRPAHSPFDGDAVFALSTRRHTLTGDRAVEIARIGALAADCMARAVARGVYEATTLGRFPAYREAHGGALRGSSWRPAGQA